MLAFSGSVVVVIGVVSFIGRHSSPIADSVARQATLGGILFAVGDLTLWFHVWRGRRIALGDPGPDGPSARVMHSYAAAVMFASTVTFIVALGIAIYLGCQLAGPGIFGISNGGRTGTWRLLIDTGYVMVLSAALALFHMRWGPPTLRARARTSAISVATPAPVTPPLPGAPTSTS